MPDPSWLSTGNLRQCRGEMMCAAIESRREVMMPPVAEQRTYRFFQLQWIDKAGQARQGDFTAIPGRLLLRWLST